MLGQKILTLDLGTSAVRASLSFQKGDDFAFYIKTAPSRGIKNGNIINMASAKESLSSALNALKLDAPTALPNEAYVLVPGGCTLGYQVEASIEFPGIKTISHNDVNVVKNKAKDELLRKKGQTVKSYYEVIHVVPQEFVVDAVDGIQNPIGRSGRRLTIKAFIVLASRSHVKTLEELLKKLNLNLKGIVLQSFAASFGIRNKNSYFNNNLVIYLGAGNTEFIYFREDKPVLSRHLPFGSEDLLEFIIKKLKVSRSEAERLYNEYGSAYAFNVSKEEVIHVNYGSRSIKVPKILIAALIQLKLRDVFRDIKAILTEEDASFFENLNGVFLTGGLSKLKDINVLAEKIFKAPVTIPPLSHSNVEDVALSPIVGVTDYILSLMDREKLSDIKEDLTKYYEKKGSFFASIWRFIADII